MTLTTRSYHPLFPPAPSIYHPLFPPAPSIYCCSVCSPLFSRSCSIQPPFLRQLFVVQQQLFNSTALCSAATCSPLFSSNSFNSAATVFVRQLFVVRHCSAAVVLFSRYCICSPFVQQQQSDHFRSTVMTAANPAQSPPYPLLYY
jgi:hypothetical protein